MRRYVCLAIVLALMPITTVATPVMPDDDTITDPETVYTAPWAPLFDGKSLFGWKALGGGHWYVEDGCLVGENGDGNHGWLVTERPYADFFLEFEFKGEAAGNSGVQIRSHMINEMMYGCQVEVDPNPGKFSGGVYEVGGRTWVAQPEGKANEVVKFGEWNVYQVSCIGDRVTATVNGVLCADWIDDQYQARYGIIALQVHAGDTKVKFRYRNMRIQDYGYGRGWTPLFNGHNLSNWNIQGDEPWEVDGDTILAWNSEAGGNGYLATKDEYTDFMVRAKYRLEGKGNSGVFFRSQFTGADVRGVQAEIDSDPKHNPAGLYESSRRGWIAVPREEAFTLFDPAGWNDIMVMAQGSHIRTWVNGFKVVDFQDDDLVHEKGQLALQVHSGESLKIRFKDVAVIDLSEE